VLEKVLYGPSYTAGAVPALAGVRGALEARCVAEKREKKYRLKMIFFAPLLGKGGTMGELKTSRIREGLG